MRDIDKLIQKLNKSTLIIKKRGKKYHVRDAVEFERGALMTEKQLLEEFG